jgi:putative SOS response-associated peptidase YedK
MCYTIEINLTREQLEKRFKANLDKHLPYRKQQRVSAFSLPDCPVVCSDEPDKIKLLTWGLIPFWSKDLNFANEIRMKTFNARAETIAEKASYKHAIKARRCLVLTNGFYEWQTRDKQKQPYYINLKDTEAFALAGVFDSWANKDTGEIFNTFSVITTRANPLMEKIHNVKKRMPVVLDEEAEKIWLDSELPLNKTLSYLKPYDEKLMYAEEVDRSLFRRNSDISENTLF